MSTRSNPPITPPTEPEPGLYVLVTYNNNNNALLRLFLPNASDAKIERVGDADPAMMKATPFGFRCQWVTLEGKELPDEADVAIE